MKGIYRIILVAAAFLLALTAFEIFLRVFKPQVTFESYQAAFTFPCFRKGDYYWLAMKPNASCILHSNAHAFPDISVRTNSLGLRGAEIGPKSPNTIRILFVGDSFTFGWGVSEDDAYPSCVVKILHDVFPDKTFESVNAGLPSTGMGRAYVFLKNEIEQINPDIVIIGFYPFSDVGYDTVVNEWLDTDSEGLPNRIQSTAAYVEPGGNLRTINMPTKFKIPVLRDMHVFALVMDTLFPEDIDTENTVITHYGTCLYKKSCRDLDYYHGRVQKVLGAIHAILEARNTPHLVVMIPSEFSVYNDIRLKYGIIAPILPWEKEYPTKLYDAFFSSNNIPNVPLRPVFLQHTNEKTYFTNDDHWNIRGHEIAAQAIAEKLQSIINHDSADGK